MPLMEFEALLSTNLSIGIDCVLVNFQFKERRLNDKLTNSPFYIMNSGHIMITAYCNKTIVSLYLFII